MYHNVSLEVTSLIIRLSALITTSCLMHRSGDGDVNFVEKTITLMNINAVTNVNIIFSK